MTRSRRKALEETETHHRQYPRDRASLAEIAQILRAADRPREASTVEELGRVVTVDEVLELLAKHLPTLTGSPVEQAIS